MTATARADDLANGPPEEQIVVTGTEQQAQSPRYTAPLVDTPQTITIITSETIAQQNLLNLRDVVATLPGITFGAGEGGGGYGDKINLRGFTADSDITVDGVRDSAQYSRTDPFNISQIEVVNGANSVYGGAGSVGGAINIATKRPSAEDETVISAGGGTDSYGRLTVDANHMFGEDVAARINLMVHHNDVPGRDVETFQRWGVAPAIAFGYGKPTQVTLLYTHQEDDNIPQYGVPYALNQFNDGPLPGVDPSTYFGYRNIDRQRINYDSATAIVGHTFSPNTHVRNLTRWEHVTQLSIVDPPQGVWCPDNGVDPWSGAACATPGTYQPSGPRGRTRDSDNEILVNQTDLMASFETGSLRHTIDAGLSVSKETYHLDNANSLRNPLGATPNPVLPVMDIHDPDNFYGGPFNSIRSSYSDNEVENKAVYLFDRIQIGDHWELNGGVRYERNDGSGRTVTLTVPYPAPPALPAATLGAPSNNSDDLFSYRFGIVYKPIENASIYFAYGNSQNPSQSSVNGSCQAVTVGSQNCNLDPEEAVNYELGAKWNINARLSLTASVFRNERTNFRVASGDPTAPEQQLDGQARVDGVAVGASGRTTKRWTVFANYTYLDSEILQNISNIAIGGGALDFQAGDPLPNTPKHSFGLWTTYALPFHVTLGYGAIYQGRYTFNRVSITSGLLYTPSYWLQRAMASYQINENVILQLNIDNLTDEVYYERIRNNATSGWATPGAGRSAVLSLTYLF